jgi:hypothetical protein
MTIRVRTVRTGIKMVEGMLLERSILFMIFFLILAEVWTKTLHHMGKDLEHTGWVYYSRENSAGTEGSCIGLSFYEKEKALDMELRAV